VCAQLEQSFQSRQQRQTSAFITGEKHFNKVRPCEGQALRMGPWLVTINCLQTFKTEKNAGGGHLRWFYWNLWLFKGNHHRKLSVMMGNMCYGLKELYIIVKAVWCKNHKIGLFHKN